MTKVQYSPEMEAQRRVSAASLDSDTGGSFAVLANLAGALVSVALIGGIGVWGYKLMVRDVSGIPIVRAAEGDMRVLPDDPGGQLARHQGLAVNTIMAEGAASGPVDAVRLAPAPVTLRPEDAPAPVVQPRPLASPEAYLEQAVMRTEEALPAPVAAPASEATPAGAEARTQPASAAEQTAPAERSAVLDAPGVRRSIRPRLRPVNRAVVQPAVYTPTPRADIDPAAIPAGTRLAQLGAFDSADIARSEWLRLEKRFGGMLADKSRVVQKVTSSGRDFYRLRAMGFRDLNDARRFCSALKAEGVDCIPVAAR